MLLPLRAGQGKRVEAATVRTEPKKVAKKMLEVRVRREREMGRSMVAEVKRVGRVE